VRSITRKHSALTGTGEFATIIKHDHLGRKVQLIDPDKGTIDYRHDVLGQAIWQCVF
jgi:hypothetical protein